MSGEIEINWRPALSRWLRLPLALSAVAALIVLVSHRPPLPRMVWATIQPTLDEQVHEAVVFIAWLLLVFISVALGWLASRPPRREEMVEHAPASWLPRKRTRRVQVRSQPSRELLELFATPRLGLAARTSEVEEAAVISSGAASAGLLLAVSDPAEDGPRMLRLFGPLSIDGTDGTGLTERATRGLIAYLALKRGRASLDELLEALWPGEAPAATRPRLWKAKRQAQRLLGDALGRRHDGYELDRRQLRFDVEEIERLRTGQPEHERLEQALLLMRGPPLDDVPYPWADSERRRLQAVQAEILVQLAVARLGKGDENGALTVAEQLIALDRLNERGWCLAMEAEGALGQRQAILDRFERLTHELDERLGLRPGAEARQTYHRLLSQS